MGNVKTLSWALAVVLVLFLALSASAGGDSLDYINAERTVSLQRDSGLASYAQSHAEAMAAAGKIYHSSLPVGTAEIVGRGGTFASIHEAFMASPSHRATLLGDFGRAGTGSTTRDGVLYVVVIFDGKTPTTTTTTEVKPSTTTTTTSIPATTTTTVPVPILVVKAPPLCPVPGRKVCLL
jgi:hypothetical protein